MDNKDYVINIRISKQTYTKLKQKARENGDTLSHLVRKSIDDGLEIFGDLKKELFGKDKNGSGAFVHYQKVVCARDMECSSCRDEIGRGNKAVIGETENGKKKYFCLNCFRD